MADSGSPRAAAWEGSLNHPETFVEAARHHGFSPDQAAALYHHKRLFQAGHWFHPDHWPHRHPYLLQFVQKVATWLEAVQSVEQWLTYAETLFGLLEETGVEWGDADMERLLGFDLLDNDTMAPTLNVLREAFTVLRQQAKSLGFNPGGLDEAPAFPDTPLPMAWSTWAPWTLPSHRQPWDWANLAATLRLDRLRWPPMAPMPHRWTVEHSKQWLNRLLTRQAVVQWSWPWVEATDPETGWRLVQTVRQFRQCLHERVQSVWQGPLLGIKGRLIIRLGGLSEHTGLHVPAGRGEVFHTIVFSSWVYPLKTLVAHEWGHAIDHSLKMAIDPRGPGWYMSEAPSPEISWAPHLTTLLHQFRINEGPADWATWRAQWLLWIQKWVNYVGRDEQEDPEWWWHHFIAWTTGRSECPSLTEVYTILHEHSALPLMGALSVYRSVWLYHHAPAAGVSFWDHCNASMQWARVAYDAEGLEQHAHHCRWPGWNRKGVQSDEEWCHSSAENWARWFDGPREEGQSLDILALSLPGARETWQEQHRQFLQQQAPHWEALPPVSCRFTDDEQPWEEQQVALMFHEMPKPVASRSR